MGIIKKWDIEDKQTNDKCIEEVMTRVEEIGDDTIGVIAAQDIIDIVTNNFGPEIYNKALRDAKKLFIDRASDIETELDLREVEA